MEASLYQISDKTLNNRWHHSSTCSSSHFQGTSNISIFRSC